MNMKKRLLLIISVLALIVVSATMLFACSSSDKFDGKSYDKMEKYYASAKDSVKKCESTLDALIGNVKAASFTSNISLERTYFSTADNNVEFKGTRDEKGYDGEDDNGNWMKHAIDYEFKYNAGNYIITAKVYNPCLYDDYDKNNKGTYTTYTYKKIGDVVTCDPAESAADVKKYCYDELFDVIFGEFTEDEFLESYATDATKGFRFVTHMMQYQMTRAFKYKEDGTIDYDNVISYTENKDATLYTAIQEEESGNRLTDAYEDKLRADGVSYWAEYGEDITYNFYKTAAVYNDRVTMTYKNKTKQLQTYEYYGERVLPFYTKKSDFKTYNVLKCVVADYTHFVAEFDYGTVEIA